MILALMNLINSYHSDYALITQLLKLLCDILIPKGLNVCDEEIGKVINTLNISQLISCATYLESSLNLTLSKDVSSLVRMGLNLVLADSTMASFLLSPLSLN